jgi:hypothetical protein
MNCFVTVCIFIIFCVKVAGGLPPQIGGMVDKTWLFKVETKPSFNPRFEQSFRVRKICTDESIIDQFKAKWDKEDATFIKNSNVCCYLLIFIFSVINYMSKLTFSMILFFRRMVL